MDCTDTSASFVSFTPTVPSMGVPRSGLAPDIKRGVLNSRALINGQKFPSLASSDLESPADDLEVGFPVELRRTVTMEREVRIPVRVRGPVNTIEVKALLDSGATGCFVDKSWALDRHLWLSKLVKPVPVLNVDGTRNQEGDIMHYVLLTVGVGKHAEKLWCAVTCLGKVPLILGHDWLKKHNPDIDWTISKPTLPWTVLDSTGQLPQRPSYSQQGTQLASTVQTIPALVPAVPDCSSSTTNSINGTFTACTLNFSST